MDYDVVRSFQRIEEELIQSMQVNMKRHIGEEFQENINWTQWQAEMLRGLQTYKKENSIKLPGYFSTINDDIDEAIRKAYATGESEQEIEVLNAIKNGYKKASKNNMQGEFFKINANKLNALIDSTVDDFKKAEKAILRTTDDAYRKIIFNTQMFYTSGATSLWQAVDMASKDFLKAGINCVQYKNGSRVNIVSYAEMAMRTTNKRANLMGQANKRMEYGVHTVKINHRGTACPMCLQWLGQVYYDDVYGSVTPAEKRGLAGLESYPLLSTAVEGGLFHPNCKDACSSYYEGISQPPKSPTKEEKQEALRRYGLEQEQRKCERNIRQYTRLEKGALSSDDAKLYADKKQAWIAKYNNLVNSNTDVLRNDPARLRLYELGGLSSGTTRAASKVHNVALQATNTSWRSYKFDNVEYNNKKEIADHLLSEYGIKFKDSRKYAIDKDLFEDCTNWLDRFTGCYSNFASKNKINIPELNVKAPSGMKNAVGYYSYYTYNNKAVELALNGKYHSNTDVFKKYVEHCVDTKWYPANATIHKTFVHEYGHHVSNSLCAVYGNDWEHKFISECIDDFKKVTPDYTYKTYAGLTDYLSQYGSTKECECFAEAFAEYFGGDNPRAFATIFGKKLEKILMGV